MKFGFRMPSLKKRIAARTSVKRMIRSKVRMPKGYGFISNPKKAIYNRIYNKTTRKACYIATAVYGSEDAWQVCVLRQYRDDVLSKNYVGLITIFLYYQLSPKLAEILPDHKLINKLAKIILDKLVANIGANMVR
jgi:hypothetical protein